MPKQKTDLEKNFNPGDLIYVRDEALVSAQRLIKALGHDHFRANHINLPLIDDLLEGRLTEEYIAQLKEPQHAHATLLLKHKEYLLAPGGKNPWPDSPKQQRSVAIRRACKLLVKEAASTHVRSLHFMLDGVNHWRVTRKKYIYPQL